MDAWGEERSTTGTTPNAHIYKGQLNAYYNDPHAGPGLGGIAERTSERINMPSLAWACFDRRRMVKLAMRSGHRKTRKVDNIDGDAHFLTFLYFRRLPLLSKGRTCQWVVDGMGLARQKNPFDLWGWVIMPEHVHLILMPHANGICVQPETSTRNLLTYTRIL